MFLRKILGSLLVIMFVLLAIPNFVIYALSRTYLNPEFYNRGEVVTGSYDYVVDKTVEVLRSGSTMFNGFYPPEQLKPQIEKVFTKTIFASILSDFSTQLDAYIENPTSTMTLSLKVLRQNLLTVSNNLIYQIYQDLPTCSDDDLASMFRNSGVPQCVPKSAPYDQVVKPIKDDFENAIYNGVPEELSNVEQVIPLKMLVSFEQLKVWSFLVLVILLGLIVLVVYGKTSVIVTYIAKGFLFAGVMGYLFAYGLGVEVATIVASQSHDASTLQFLRFFTDFGLLEIQKIALMFAGVGVLLWVIRIILIGTVEMKVE